MLGSWDSEVVCATLIAELSRIFAHRPTGDDIEDLATRVERRASDEAALQLIEDLKCGCLKGLEGDRLDPTTIGHMLQSVVTKTAALPLEVQRNLEAVLDLLWEAHCECGR